MRSCVATLPMPSIPPPPPVDDYDDERLAPSVPPRRPPTVGNSSAAGRGHRMYAATSDRPAAQSRRPVAPPPQPAAVDHGAGTAGFDTTSFIVDAQAAGKCDGRRHIGDACRRLVSCSHYCLTKRDQLLFLSVL